MELEIQTTDRLDVVDVTSTVEDALSDAVESGTCTVFVPHTTAGVIVNENERRLLADLENALERLLPRGDGYEHDAIDDNADAHLRATILGESVTVPIVEGELALGTWQSILFVDCDGPRRRRLRVTVLSA
ncbi:secondary thiamine-phosphate synthase enzyme YjbQ [Natronosalvus halobius]|uniref:secondary thiamine-phosphate synthase enzyme YjbQ n=1 Tax=Natronosalvus halobius TaxID=2953746 RepID=UPI0020A04089|nr:secondary thiamine-phosphate synthase enzyme YjbQ [Natronosalvus halobius]USZ73458.1 secondary thiamine-phosphate synthase enzyme YjbQ [Natronosalvus halobius]